MYYEGYIFYVTVQTPDLFLNPKYKIMNQFISPLPYFKKRILLKVKHQIFNLLLLLFILCFITINTTAQNNDFCGRYVRSNTPSLIEIQDQDVLIDRFGNYYLKSELLVGNSEQTSLNCSNSSFNLNFDQGFTPEEEETVCEVFNYINQVLGEPVLDEPAELLITKESLPGAVGATGSPFWDATCGVASSTIYEKILGSSQGLSQIFFDGIIRIDSEIPEDVWHTLSEDPTVEPFEIDLFSVVLHEALHVLGYASLIGADGTPFDVFDDSGNLLIDNDAYSKWDTYIYSNINNQYIVEAAQNNDECCDQKMFNADDFLNMPDPVDGDCSNGIVFNGSSVAPNVNNLSDLSGVDPAQLDFAVANKLSHLHRDCNNPAGEIFVLHPGVSTGQDGVNRIISDTELEIMCDLGYPVANLCGNQCAVIAQDDFIIRYNTSSAINISNLILDNDILPNDFEFSIDLECGNLPTGSYSYPGNGFNLIFLTNTPPPGLYYFCYTVTGCDGAICDEGIVYLYHGTDPCENECNLFCQGSFENFLPLFNTYFLQLGIDPFEFDGLHNSPNFIYVENDNQVVNFVRDYDLVNNSGNESIYFPLSSPVDPGCTLTISFQATADSENATLQIFASENPPCSAAILPTCDDTGFVSCPNYIMHCMTIPPAGSIDAPLGIEITNSPDLPTIIPSLLFGDPFNDNLVPYPFDFDIGQLTYLYGFNFGTYSFEWTNTTNTPVNYITIFGNSTVTQGDTRISYYMDDIEIYSDCSDSQVTIIPAYIEEPCVGNKITIDYEVCNVGTGSTPSNIALTIGDLPVGVAFTNGGDFVSGELILEEVLPNSPCITVSLELTLSNDLIPGSILTVPMDAEIDNACWMDSDSSTVELTLLESCEDDQECDAVLVAYGYGENCDNEEDDFDPTCVSPCLRSVTNLGPYNGGAPSGSGASCTDSIICVASTLNGWEFTMTAGENMELHYLMANFLYPINDDTAGGSGNDTTCAQQFPYVISFFLNNDIDPIYTVSGTIPPDEFTTEFITLPVPIEMSPEHEIRVRIDGDVDDSDCDLFELSSLSAHGCCIPCPSQLADLGPDQTICLGEEITLTAEANGSELVVSKVQAGNDDAEEKPNGNVDLESSDLDLVDASLPQTVGIRFNDINIPQGAIIVNAYIQFTANDSDSGSASLVINGQDDDNASAFETSANNISSRPLTLAGVDWSPATWIEDDAGFDQRTPDLSEIVQGIINRTGWSDGNSMAFIFTGSGTRVAESFDNSSSKAPKIVIEYENEGVGPFTYQWENGANTQSITESPVTTTTYFVSITDANDCIGEAKVTVDVDGSCCTGLEVQIDCKDAPYVTLTAIIDGVVVDPNLFNVQWIIADIVYPPSQNPLTVINEIGSNYSVMINQIGSGISNCSGNGIIECEDHERGLIIFPNPSEKGEELFLSCSDDRFLNEEVFYTITTELSQQITSGNLVIREKTKLPKLKVGVYLIHLLNKKTGARETIQFQVNSH